MTEEPLLLVGHVDGDGHEPVLVVARLEAAGKTIVRDKVGELVLAVDGRKVRIEIEPDRIGQAHVTGRWESVAGDRVARLFRDEAPGDHVKVKIAGVALFPGDVMAVRGEAVDVGAEGGDGGYRDAPEMRVTRLRGVAAGVAADEAGARAKLDEIEAEARERAEAQREKEADRRREEGKKAEKKAATKTKRLPRRIPWRWGTRVSVVFAAGIIAFALGTATGRTGLMPLPAFNLALLAVGLHFAGLAVYCWTVRFDSPKVHEVGGRHPMVKREPWPAYVYGWTFLAPGMAAGATYHTYKSMAWARAGLALTIVVPLILLVIAIVRARRPARRLWQVLRARRLSPDAADGTWGTIEGDAEALSSSVPDDDSGDAAAAAQSRALLRAVTSRIPRSSTRTYTVQTKDGGTAQREDTTYWSDLATSLAGVEEFGIKTDAGLVRVTTAGAIWSAPTVWKRMKKKPTESACAVARISPGHRVRVLGRIRRDGDHLSFKGAGPESLFITRSSPARLLLAVLAPVLAQTALIAAITIVALW